MNALRNGGCTTACDDDPECSFNIISTVFGPIVQSVDTAWGTFRCNLAGSVDFLRIHSGATSLSSLTLNENFLIEWLEIKGVSTLKRMRWDATAITILEMMSNDALLSVSMPLTVTNFIQLSDMQKLETLDISALETSSSLFFDSLGEIQTLKAPATVDNFGLDCSFVSTEAISVGFERLARPSRSCDS